jgi:formylglycine-generating enzyme required for sulfatase activity
MGNNPSRLNRECDKCPVESISWNDAQEYIRRLNDLTKRGYRLPTPPEWEYASKGGKLSKGFYYSGSNNVNTVAWFCDNAGQKTQPVGTKQSNELGLYDMSGNVGEWCFVDPSLVTSQVIRGGSVSGEGVYRCEEECRNSISDHCVPSGSHYATGLRLILPIEK